MGRQERECPEIDRENFGERAVPGAHKVLGHYSQEEGTDKKKTNKWQRKEGDLEAL